MKYFFLAIYKIYNKDQTSTYLKYFIVQEHHDDTWNVEGPEWWVYHVVGAVEETLVGTSIGSVVETQDYWWADGSRDQPGHCYHSPDTSVALVLCVFYWLRHGYVPVDLIILSVMCFYCVKTLKCYLVRGSTL